MKPLRMAVVGVGHLGRIHARLIGQLSGAALTAVADPDQEARTRTAAEGGCQAVADPRDLPEGIDAAVVAVPTPLHHRTALQLIERGIHVLVEKPITTTVDEADELIAAAQRRGVVLAVGHVERFNPALAAAAPFLTAPRYIEAARMTGYTFRSTDVGVVLDLMIHDLDAILSLVRHPVVRVEAQGTAVLGPQEDFAQARLVFADGCIAHLKASRASFTPERRMHVYSESGHATIDFAARTARVLRPHPRLLSGQWDVHALSHEEKNRLKETLFSADGLLPVEEIVPGETNPLLDELRDFAAAITTGSRPRVDGVQGRDALGVARWIQSQIAERRWDAAHGGPAAPHFAARPFALPGPHWMKGAEAAEKRRRAG